MSTQRQHAPVAESATTPAASVHLRAAEVITEQRHKLFAHVASAVDGRDPEGVHDMRVASRRLRACLKVFAPWLDNDDLQRLGRAVRSLTRALGTVREIDVLRLRLAGLAAQGSPERALAIECVDARLARRRRKARTRMMARFAKVDIDRLEGRLHRLASQLARSASSDASEEAVVVTAAPAAAGDALAPPPSGNDAPQHREDQPIVALLENLAGAIVGESRDACFPLLPEQVGSAHAAEALHGVRIAAKKLRYTLEIVAPYLGEAGAAAVRRLRVMQDKLGDFHDDTVLDATLRREIDRATEREHPLLAAELRALRNARRRALLRNERAVRDAIAQLREEDFVALVARALADAGVTAPPPAESAEPTPESAAAAAGTSAAS